MSKQTEALKLALEALKQIDEAMPFPVAKLAQKAIREALAEQPVQVDPCIDGSCSCCWTHLDEQPAQQQEPVQTMPREWRSALQKLAFMARTSGGTAGRDSGLVEAIETAEALLSLPYLYTSPQPAQRKPWVGLTDEDIQEVRENCGITHHAIKTIEAKLREKNT